MKKKLTIHAIILALNESQFIKVQLDTIYQFCDRISIITQYDRDWYGKGVVPDETVNIVLDYPDPVGKINLLVRRLPDEAAARNMEMLAFNNKTFSNIMSHGNTMKKIEAFHEPPDYFWIIDADEIYDIATIPKILSYLSLKRPKGMRITGFNYLRTWNKQVPRSVIDFTHFGFLKPGVLFEQRRVVSWNEFRLSKLFGLFKLPDLSAKIFGFIDCPESVGVFHHACWLGDNNRIEEKFSKSSHQESQTWEPNSVDGIRTIFIPTRELPLNIQNAVWPPDFINE